jgi:hypothetical protein
MIRRSLRPPDRQKRQDPNGVDEKTGRDTMEASENAGMSRPGRGGPALHRIDPDRVAQTLSSDGNAAGFARLDLMVNIVFDRLVAAEGEGLEA